MNSAVATRALIFIEADNPDIHCLVFRPGVNLEFLSQPEEGGREAASQGAELALRGFNTRRSSAAHNATAVLASSITFMIGVTAQCFTRGVPRKSRLPIGTPFDRRMS